MLNSLMDMYVFPDVAWNTEFSII